jgi:5'-nucleotidase
MTNKPLILVTNDDGYDAPGLQYLINLMRSIGDVVAVVSEQSQSAMGHAITMKVPLVYREAVAEDGYKMYITNGTPADCIKLGLHKILDRHPDIVVSGINHGSNSSINIIYSGTMAAVLEAAMGGIPAVGFSLQDYSHNADFSKTDDYILKIVREILKNGLPEGTGLNVNFPKLNGSPYKGLKICRQSKAYWKEDFSERYDPRNNKPYFWLTGTFHILEDSRDTDEWALANYYVSAVPVKFDFTAHDAIDSLSNIKWN